MNNDNKNIISPSLKNLLDQYDPKRGLDIPDGYFNDLPELIFTKIKEDDITIKKPSLKVIFLNSPFLKGAVAACIIIMLSIASLNIINHTKGDDIFANVSEERGWEYILDISDEYGIDDFAELPEMEEAITNLESELYGINMSDEFIEDVEFEIVEDLFK